MADSQRRFYWLKLKEDFFDDKVIKYLRRLPEGSNLVIIYLKMQLKSLKTDGLLKYDGILPTCEEELALLLDEDPMLVSGAINALVKMGVVERWENDALYMAAMQDLIGTESSSAARVRRHRDKKQAEALQCNAKMLPCNTNVTPCNADETMCNVEIERRDREKRKELDTEIERREEAAASPAPAPVPYAKVREIYNSICTSYPACKSLSESRKKAIAARMKSGYTLEDFRVVFEKAQASSFLRGRNSRNWRASFDWLIKDSNMAKVLEGNYDDGPARPYHPAVDDLDFIPN